MYSIRLGSRAVRELQDVPTESRAGIVEAIEGLGRDPRPSGWKKLSGPLAGSYRIRIGSFRVIYDVYDSARVVLVIKSGPRKSIYR